MKLNTPLVTLLTGAALGIVLLVASMLAAHTKTPGFTAASSSSSAPAAIPPATPAGSGHCRVVTGDLRAIGHGC